ncbi:GAF domain-containing protein [Anaerolineales bacterium HSG25]|nr:GAF domain-containing protein [Anaerolineales bacterium HSG25]
MKKLGSSSLYRRLQPPPSLHPKKLANQNVESLAQEIKDMTALYNAGIAIGSALSLQEIVWTLYKECSRLLNTANFAIAIYDAANDALSFGLVFDGKKQIAPFAVRFSSNRRLTKLLISNNRPTLFVDLTDTDYQTELNRIQPDTPIRAWLGMPIGATTKEKAEGALLFWDYKANCLTERDVWLASALSIQAAIAIRNIRLHETYQRQAQESMALNEVARTLASTLSLDEVLTRIMEQVETLLDSEAGSLLLTDHMTGELVFQIALGGKADEIKPFRIPKGQGIAGEIALTGKSLRISDAHKDKRHFRALDKQTDFLTRNILGVPLILHDNVIGVLEVMNKRRGSYSQRDLELMESIASYAAIAIENARLHEHVLEERNRVIAAEEQARKELARDLHDGPTQLVASIMMSLDFTKKALEKDPSLVPRELDEMTDLAGRASHQMRTLLFELRPLVLETSGLQPAIEMFLERRQKDIGGLPRLMLKIEANTPSGEISRVDKKTETTIFAIVQETVNNAIKHAHAQSIIVTLRDDYDGLYTSIVDDGSGFNVSAVMSSYESRGSLGMVNLQERTEIIGGELKIESTEGKGSKFILYVPNEQAERAKRRVVTGPLRLPPNMR